ncbi:hypothetical protein BDZ89DRAFT_1066935 [Hymenopellis radicata]|nr:hypothetical protein BDZ89DRAFT_1066935 [Hymenopellis radicata]
MGFRIGDISLTNISSSVPAMVEIVGASFMLVAGVQGDDWEIKEAFELFDTDKDGAVSIRPCPPLSLSRRTLRTSACRSRGRALSRL